jgi:hypothetical protein
VLGIQQEVGGEDLDRDFAPEPFVARAVHLPHAARSEETEHLEGAEPGPGRESHGEQITSETRMRHANRRWETRRVATLVAVKRPAASSFALPASLVVAMLLGSPKVGAEGPRAVEEVASLLAGTFDSKAQAEADPKGFRAVRLVAVLVPGSRLGESSPVLYVEQALLATPDKPYSQRFCRIEETADRGVIARVFEPRVPLSVSGKWRDPADLALHGSGDVVERIGCAVRLKRTAEGWEGGTEGKSCPSALSGARYATSRVKLVPGRMESWDRGYDLEERQVWGAKEGPYLFERRSAGPPADAAR